MSFFSPYVKNMFLCRSEKNPYRLISFCRSEFPFLTIELTHIILLSYFSDLKDLYITVLLVFTSVFVKDKNNV